MSKLCNNESFLQLDTQINYATVQLMQVLWGSLDKYCNSATGQMIFIASYSRAERETEIKTETD
jgi:hypothetical protein